MSGRWTEHAACRTVDPELWFPIKGNTTTGKLAQQICQTCPVIAPCLSYAMAQGYDCEGIWGGTTAAERAELRRAARAVG